MFERIDLPFARRADSTWQKFLDERRRQSVANGDTFTIPEYGAWQWEEKVKLTAHLLAYASYGVECDGEIQGLMIVRTSEGLARLPEQALKPLLIVEYLAAAPWNVPWIVAEPRFRGVGTLLMGVAMQESEDLGFHGRIGLHSLRKAEGFYERKGMQCLGPDANKRGLKYYEMTAAQATEFLREEAT